MVHCPRSYRHRAELDTNEIRQLIVNLACKGAIMDVNHSCARASAYTRCLIQHAMLMRSRVAGSTSCSNCAERNNSSVPARGKTS